MVPGVQVARIDSKGYKGPELIILSAENISFLAP